jgi:oxygen-independent coproporphyrinogen III oxidase
MKLLAESPDRVDVEKLIRDQVQGDYIYMYPPRQAYYPMSRDVLEPIIASSLEGTATEPLNLYVHFPFCKQVCGFCNLYSVVARPDEAFARYVDTVGRELRRFAGITTGRPVDTIYLGGGTPSILPARELDRCLSLIESAFRTDRSLVAEVALEVAPDTVNLAKLRDLVDIGINRINLGLQTTSDAGLQQIGRRHDFARARGVIDDALTRGFDNVCIDLIYGLPGQSIEDWQQTVMDVVAFGAPTICAYPLTLRPGTGFAHKTFELCGVDQYSKYEIARELLCAAGYAQETHVRYVIPAKGGYRQKRNHWAGQDILGVGAGARGYLRECDYRNGYSIRRRRSALEAYYDNEAREGWTATSGFCLDADERMRRHVILGLLDLDRDRFRAESGADVLDLFGEQISKLERLDLLTVASDRIRLTSSGRKYRDLLVQMFFSSEVWKRISDFDYME